MAFSRRFEPTCIWPWGYPTWDCGFIWNGISALPVGQHTRCQSYHWRDQYGWLQLCWGFSRHQRRLVLLKCSAPHLHLSLCCLISLVCIWHNKNAWPETWMEAACMLRLLQYWTILVFLSGRARFWEDAYIVSKWTRNQSTQIRRYVPTKRNGERNDAFQKNFSHRVHDSAK